MKNVYNYLKNFLKANDVVVIGCSGGPDSMALFDLLMKIRKEIKISIICAHVDHNVRKQSKNEAIFVSDFCKKHDVIFETMTITKYSDDNFENEARNIRYNFFNDLMQKYNGTYLMTAHHGDDLIETILMRIVRGSTLIGYSGFSQEINHSNYKIIRPLITVTKKELIDYDKKNNISYAIDKTNFDNFHTRNRYRKIVLPFLKKEDPNVHEKFLKYSKTLQMYDEYISKQMINIINDVINNDILDINKYKKLDSIIKYRVLYSMLEKEYVDDLFLINDSHVSIINKLIYSNKPNGYIYLPNDIKVIKSYNELTIKKFTDQIDSYDMELSDYCHLPNGKEIDIIDNSDCNDNNYCRLSYENVTLPLHIRTRKNGDKMYLKGLEKEKKVKDIFINSKVPIKDRDLWPILVDSKDKILWIPGLKKSKFDIPKNKNCDIILKYR